MSTIWAVSSGDYSDYRVHAIFTTKEKADLYAEALPNGDVEDFELDPEPDMANLEFMRSGDSLWQFKINLRNGNIELVKYHSYYSPRHVGYETVAVKSWGNARSWFDQEPHLVGSVRAFDEESAAKIANEYRTRFKTEWDMEKTIEKARVKEIPGVMERLLR